MKTVYDVNLQTQVSVGSDNILLGWVKSRRGHKNLVFLDVCDSTGFIQVVVDKDQVSNEIFEIAQKIPLESSIRVEGTIAERVKNQITSREIVAKTIKIIGTASRNLSPQPRSNIDIFDSSLADHLLKNRHLYLRNAKVMAILRFRHVVMGVVQQWFRENGFIEITAPVLTPLPLYDDGTAISVTVDDQKIYLTQCVGFYLESAVHAFERVYNIGPSFRGEESRSKRHLMEYWHIKAEVAFGDLEDIISFVESLISYTVEHCQSESSFLIEALGTGLNIDGLAVPFPRISYRDAVSKLKQQGVQFEFGESLGSDEEAILSSEFQTPFWVTGIPRKIEPFPYVIDQNDIEVTRTADLIASRGYGELLGVAEKITDFSMLEERMKEKGKFGNEQYDWLTELREFGCVPHIGFGMGVERLIRWLLCIPHVRDAMPFPRIFRRRVQP